MLIPRKAFSYTQRTNFMKTSAEWWASTKSDPEALMKWLRNQYHGEVTAATRIRELILVYEADPKWRATVEEIASQEEQHAEWVGELLKIRGEDAKVLEKKERYWDQTLKQITDWDTGCAVAAHAEAMRLDRIRAICNDKDAPQDIKEVFGKILVQEEFHEKAFRAFTTDDAMRRTLDGHLAGMNELGLVP
jgi:rubrerythrin